MTPTGNYPRGALRSRLRGQPLPCPLAGEARVGAVCLGAGCVYAAETEGFVDCELCNREVAGAATVGGRPS